MGMWLVAIDLDNTLLDAEGKVPCDFFQFVECVSDLKEWRFVIASGRQLYNIKTLLGRYHDRFDIIAENGATILFNGQIIFDGYLDRRHAAEILRQYSSKYDGMLIYKNDMLMAYQVGDVLRNYLDSNKVSYSVCDVMPDFSGIKKISFFSKSEINVLPDIALSDNLKYEISTPHLLDFTRADYSKGNALALIQSYLGIDSCNTLAFGDSQTDISMFKIARYSFAMQNAADEVKRYANFVAPPCYSNGVTRVLIRFKQDMDVGRLQI